MKFKKDTRDKLWARMERDIQKRGNKKDKKITLGGKWKKFIRKQDGFKIYAVDGEWVKSNLSVTFHHGGHGYVHEFIPHGEIWVETHHSQNCGCKNVKKNQKVSQPYFDSAVIHEITEFKLMKKGMIYWRAHQIALQKEMEVGLLKDPFTEIE